MIKNILIGDLSDANDLEDLRKRGVTHILNLRFTELPSWEGFTYCRCPVWDEEERLRADSIARALKFIDSALRGEGQIIVYCRDGVDRAPFVAALYLYYFRGASLWEAYEWVKEIRPKAAEHFEWFSHELDKEIRMGFM